MRAAAELADKLREAAAGMPLVVLTGRANAGKSTLFNALSRRGRAITSAIAGTTRDLNLGTVEHDDRAFAIVDTGGLDHAPELQESARAADEAMRVIAHADAVIFVL